MEDLVAALFSWLVRGIAGPRPPEHVPFSAAPAAPGTSAAPPSRRAPFARPATPPSTTVNLPSRTPAATRPGARIDERAATSSEPGLVASLFTSPRSLAAAVVASEILQPPVALR
jgi:hypothetical protein